MATRSQLTPQEEAAMVAGTDTDIEEEETDEFETKERKEVSCKEEIR